MQMQDTDTMELTVRKLNKAGQGDAMGMSPATLSMKLMPDDLGPEGIQEGQIAVNSMAVHLALHHSSRPLGQVTRSCFKAPKREATVLHVTLADSDLLARGNESDPCAMGS
jgi:hypothetical protein